MGIEILPISSTKATLSAADIADADLHLLEPGRRFWALKGIACTAAFVALLTAMAGGPHSLLAALSPRRVSEWTCLGGWPEFRSMVELEADTAWAEYVSSVYRALPQEGSDAYPLCIGELWYLYERGLAPMVDELPETSDCPRAGGSVPGQRYQNHSTLAPPGVTWSWHPAPDGFEPLRANAWVEVMHKGGIGDEHVGAWFLSARGSGIWFNVGVTVFFDDHADAWDFFDVAALPRDERNEALCANASAAGYDSVQFVRHTCPMMYRDCLDTNSTNLAYFNREVVSTRLVGVHACASADGASPLLRTGWPSVPEMTGPCTCDNNASEHLHCAEVLYSLPHPLEPEYPMSLGDDLPLV